MARRESADGVIKPNMFYSRRVSNTRNSPLRLAFEDSQVNKWNWGEECYSPVRLYDSHQFLLLWNKTKLELCRLIWGTCTHVLSKIADQYPAEWIRAYPEIWKLGQWVLEKKSQEHRAVLWSSEIWAMQMASVPSNCKTNAHQERTRPEIFPLHPVSVHPQSLSPRNPPSETILYRVSPSARVEFWRIQNEIWNEIEEIETRSTGWTWGVESDRIDTLQGQQW